MTSVPIDQVIDQVHRAYKRGDMVRTVGMVRELTRQAGQDPRSRHLQAITAIEFGQAREATALLETLVFELTGEPLRDATIDLARARELTGDLGAAWTTIRPEIEADEPRAAAIATAARIRFAMGEADEALKMLDDATPDEKHAHEIAMARGFIALRTLIEDPACAAREQAAIDALQAEADRIGVPARSLMPLLIDLGELLARRGEDAAAARCWKRSAGLNANRIDPRTYAKSVAELTGSWSGKALSRARSAESGPGVESERPIFVVGMPGAGTGLVSSILAAHPGVAVTENREALNTAVGRHLTPGSQEPIVRNPSTLTGMQLAAAAKEYLDRTEPQETTGGGAIRVVDPFELNLHTLGVIAQVFPKATVVFVSRSPFDACLAAMLSHRDPRLLYVHDPRALVVFANGIATLMGLWQRIFAGEDLPLRHVVVSHDALANDHEARVALFEAIGVETPDTDTLNAAAANATRWTSRQAGLADRFAPHLQQLSESSSALSPGWGEG